MQGHEIGNHSVCHEHAGDLNKAGEELQVEDAKKFLDSNFKSDILTFAYPFTEVSPGLLYWVKRYDYAARVGVATSARSTSRRIRSLTGTTFPASPATPSMTLRFTGAGSTKTFR